MNESKQKIALFIDADNAPASKFEEVLSEVAKYGVVTIRKAYGNWKNPTIKPWEDLLHEYAIQPIQQYDLTKGKNASDIALVIDAMDVMYTKDIDVMCFVSSDCDGCSPSGKKKKCCKKYKKKGKSNCKRCPKL